MDGDRMQDTGLPPSASISVFDYQLVDIAKIII